MYLRQGIRGEVPVYVHVFAGQNGKVITGVWILLDGDSGAF